MGAQTKTSKRSAPDHPRPPRSHGGNGSPPAPSPAEWALEAALRSATVLGDRLAFGKKAGLSFPTTATHSTTFDRDLDHTLGYPIKPDFALYADWYERGGIAERIIEAPARATWAGGASLVEDPDPGETTEFEAAFLDLADRTDLFSRLLRADILARIGRYSVLVIGDTRVGLTEDLPTGLSGPESIAYLRAYSEEKATINEGDLDSGDTSPRRGLPLRYELRTSGTPVKTPWTRVIHLAEGCLTNDLYGKPALRAALNYLVDMKKLTGGGSEAAWMQMNPPIHISVPLVDEKNNPIVWAAAEEDALQDQVDEMRHRLRYAVKTRGAVELKRLAGEVYDFGPNVAALRELIAGTVGTPQRILFGSERGELASNQDRGNWHDRIQERRREFAVPVARDLADRMIEHGALPKPVEYEVTWPETDELTEEEKAKVTDLLAAANQKQALATGQQLLSADEIRDRIWKMSPAEDAGVTATGNGPLAARARLAAAKLRLAKLRGRSAVAGFRSAAEDFDLSDSPAREPEWKAVHRAADAHRDSLARLVAGTWTDAADALDSEAAEGWLARVDLAALRQAEATRESRGIDADDPAYAEQVERILSEPLRGLAAVLEPHSLALSEVLPDRLLAVLNDGALAVLRSARARGSFYLTDPGAVRGALRSAFEFSFDLANPRAVEWAAFHSNTLVVEIDKATMEGLREYLRLAFLNGDPPAVLARNLRTIIGLRSDQSRAVQNLLDRLLAAEPGDLVMAGKTKIRVPKSGMTQELADQRAAEYARRLLNQRARLIARTETLTASNTGQRELWKQAQDKGLLPANVKRIWIVTPDDRLRDTHREMRGQVVGIDEPFTFPDGRQVMVPSDPNERCTTGLVRPEDLEEAA